MSVHHLIAASAPVYLLGLKAVINQHENGAIVLTYKSGEDALRALNNYPRGYLWWAIPTPAAELAASVVIPVMSRYPELRLVVLQRSCQIGVVRELFQYGVVGFLSDLCSADEIADAIKVTSERNKYIDHRLALSAIYQDPSTASGKHSFFLTEREREVLKLIVDEYTTREIAAKLFISKCTVETHRLHLIRKLGVKNTAGLVREAINQALCLHAS
jgi:DNA-binding NarL/FixJ family response regulator